MASITDTRLPVIQPRTRSMTYDARDRLATTTYAYNGRTLNYTYDVLDNLRTTRETPGGRSHNHEYAADGRLTRLVDPAAPSTVVIGYTYDARGNATSRTSATGFVPNTTAIVVDEANRIRSATVGADTETYTYDGLGRRTRVTVGANTSMHFYSQPGQLLLWENPASVAKSQQYNIYLGTKRIARRHSTGPVYVHTDHLGSLLAETSVAPVTLVSSSPHWEPYGAPAGGAFWGALQYAGHYQDGTTRLTYMQQRYYDPYAGRFLAVDPVAASPDSTNRYWYANNNPYKYTDPDGRLAFAIPLIPPAVAAVAKATAFVGTAALAAWMGSEAINSYNESSESSSPPVPEGLVGQQDGKSGQQGARVNNGPLSPEHGGTGDSQKDFEVLTGGNSEPAPTDKGYPQGTTIGENGISHRPETKASGARIDIPASGQKPHETLHYPKASGG